MSVKKAKDDEVYCNSIGKSISDIIHFSLDEDFRRSSFKLFDVSSTKEIEREISKRLLSLIRNETTNVQNNKKPSRKRRKSLLNENGKENQLEFKETSCNKGADDSSNISLKNDSHMPPQSISQKNWLQISSQQFRKVIKKRKLNYFSQPHTSEVKENDFEFISHNFLVSNSQPASSVFYQTPISSSEHLDGLNYWQKMFEESFKDNARKYFKRNLKSFKHITF